MTPNVLEPEWDGAIDLPPFGGRIAQVARQAGAERVGASLYEILPGRCVSPYHCHHANEELVVVLEGQATVRLPDGDRQLAAGDVASFPAGRRGAHQVWNRSDRALRVLIVSTMVFPDVVEHLDSEKVLALSEAPGSPTFEQAEVRATFRRADEVEPLLDEITR